MIEPLQLMTFFYWIVTWVSYKRRMGKKIGNKVISVFLFFLFWYEEVFRFVFKRRQLFFVIGSVKSIKVDVRWVIRYLISTENETSGMFFFSLCLCWFSKFVYGSLRISYFDFVLFPDVCLEKWFQVREDILEN